MPGERGFIAGDVLPHFYDMNRRLVDGEGIRIPHGAVQPPDGSLIILALAMHGPSALHDAFLAVARAIVEQPDAEVVWGWDHYVKPGQGLETSDCLSVNYWDRTCWRFGVIPYTPGKDGAEYFGPIMWDAAPWVAMLRESSASLVRAVARYQAAGALSWLRPGASVPKALRHPLLISASNAPPEPAGSG